MADNLADTELDNPAAKARFDAAVKAAVAGGWIEEEFTGSPTSTSEQRRQLPVPAATLLVSALLPVSARLFACSPPCLCVALHRCCWFGTRRRLGNPACWPAAQRLCLACCLSCLPALNSPRPPRCCCCCCRRCCPRRHTRHPWRHKRQRPPRRALWPGRAGLQGGRPGHCEGVL